MGFAVVTKYLVDANHLSRCGQSAPELVDRFHAAAQRGHRFGSIVPVLCEIEVGLASLPPKGSMYRRLKTNVGFVKIWPLEVEIAPVYGWLGFDLKKRGRKLSQVDLLLATMAIHYRLTILTTDRDFEAVPAIRTENWLA